MLLSEVFPEDYIALDEAGLKDRLGKMARVGALGAAGLIGGYGLSAYDSTPSNATKPPTSITIPAPEKLDDEPPPEEPLPVPRASTLQQPAPSSAEQPSTAQTPAPAAQPPSKPKATDPNAPHSAFPKELLNQRNLQPAERVSNFIKVITPIINQVNSEILADRDHLAKISAKDHIMTDEDRSWIDSKIDRYDATNIIDLWKRMDIIPPSMAVAQSGIETGWGISNMSRNALAFFGQKVFDKKDKTAFKDKFGDRYKSSGSLKDSIKNYVLNLNTNVAYKDFRDARAKIRHDHKPMSGKELAAYLQKYSTNPDYIKKVQGAIAGTQIAGLEPK